jgi:predicted metal-dependent hydrolase
VKQQSIVYGDEVIIYCRKPRNSVSSRILIQVNADGSITVSAPESAGDERVQAAVKKRARWIYRQLQSFQNRNEHILPRHYVSGECHLYLGKRYVLKVLVDAALSQRVKLLKGKLEVTTRYPSSENVKVLLLGWYKDRAREVFARRLDALLPQALWVADKPPLYLRTMLTQWGSCSPHGRLTINPHLVKASTECIDYVLLHELCHIAEHNHSERFYRLMNQVMPNWQQVKERLDAQAAILLNV